MVRRIVVPIAGGDRLEEKLLASGEVVIFLK